MESVITFKAECYECAEVPTNVVYMTKYGRFGTCCDKHLQQMMVSAFERVRDLEDPEYEGD